MGLVLKLDLGLWLAESETFGDTGTDTFPKLGVDNVGKPIELALLHFGTLGLTSLGSMRALIASAHTLMVLALLACIFLRPFLLSFLAKHK